MNNKTKYIIYIIVFIVMIVLLNIGYKALLEKNAPRIENTVQTNTSKKVQATEITVYDKEGNPVLLSQFKGKPIVLNFWASWCGPCREEMPDFQKIYEQEKDEVVFIMLNATDQIEETKEKAEKFIQEKGYTFPVYYDLKMEGITNYGINGFPTTIFIDKDFNVVAEYQSRMRAQTILQYIEKIK